MLPLNFVRSFESKCQSGKSDYVTLATASTADIVERLLYAIAIVVVARSTSCTTTTQIGRLWCVCKLWGMATGA
jgi:hypothetical protein